MIAYASLFNCVLIGKIWKGLSQHLRWIQFLMWLVHKIEKKNHLKVHVIMLVKFYTITMALKKLKSNDVFEFFFKVISKMLSLSVLLENIFLN